MKASIQFIAATKTAISSPGRELESCREMAVRKGRSSGRLVHNNFVTPSFEAE